MRLAKILCGCLFGMALGGPAQALSIDLRPFLKGEAIDVRLDLAGVTAKDGRCHLDVALVAPGLWSDLDARIAARGNLGSSRNRLFWVGPTRLRGVEGGTDILLTSRARYESWAIFKILGKRIKNKNFQDTKTVDFRLRPVWDGAADRLTLAYEIQNIRNVPGEIESQLRRLGVEFGGETSVEVPRDEARMQALDPRIEAPLAFSAVGDGQGLRVESVVSLTLPEVELFLGVTVDSCTALKGLLETVPEKALALVVTVIARL